MTSANLSNALKPILSRVRDDVTAAKNAQGKVFRTDDPITSSLIRKHLNGGPARGVYPILPGESVCRIALLDLDSHKGETSWKDMTSEAMKVIKACAQKGLEIIPWRSSGGKGVHLYILWDEPQDAYSVRSLLEEVLASIGYKNGTGGVASQQIEIFPKQDKVEEGRFGNQFFLPLTGKSLPLETLFDLEVMQPEYALSIDWKISKPVTKREKPKLPTNVLPTYSNNDSAAIKELRLILSYIKPSIGDDFDYDLWVKIGAAIHFETEGSAEGLSLWDELSARGVSYQGYEECEEKWETFKHNGERVVTISTLKYLAREGGYIEDYSKDFEILDELEGSEHNQAVIIPNPNDWPHIARMLLDDSLLSNDGKLMLRFAQRAWFKYTGKSYANCEIKSMEATVRRYLDNAFKLNPSKPNLPPISFCPNTRHINETLRALETETLIENSVFPMWLDDLNRCSSDYVVLDNGLLHLTSKKLCAHTPDFFAVNALPYAWDEGAEITNWLTFLASLWQDDPESISCLQEMFGYLLTPDTSLQKMFLIKGPPRSGKGTIGRVLRALLGFENAVDTSFGQLAGRFGMQALIGKLVAFLPEARNTGSRLGSNLQVAVERMLTISGDDGVSVERKNITDWSGTLPVRFVMMANAVPNLGDSSGAFASRFIVLETVQSFLGKEDDALTNKLLKELPGIFQWALEGRERLKLRGYFIQPANAQNLMDELADANNPIRVFGREMCEFGDYEIEKLALWHEYKRWCSDGNRNCGTYQTFCTNVVGTFLQHGVRSVDKGKGQGKKKIFRGIRLKIDWEDMC